MFQSETLESVTVTAATAELLSTHKPLQLVQVQSLIDIDV